MSSSESRTCTDSVSECIEHGNPLIQHYQPVGASSLERLPVETAMKHATEEFKSIRLKL